MDIMSFCLIVAWIFLLSGYDRYYNKYINVKKGGIGGVAMLIIGYVAVSYIWEYDHISKALPFILSQEPFPLMHVMLKLYEGVNKENFLLLLNRAWPMEAVPLKLLRLHGPLGLSAAVWSAHL